MFFDVEINLNHEQVFVLFVYFDVEPNLDHEQVFVLFVFFDVEINLDHKQVFVLFAYFDVEINLNHKQVFVLFVYFDVETKKRKLSKRFANKRKLLQPTWLLFITKRFLGLNNKWSLFLPATSISGAAFCLAPKMLLTSQIFTFLSH